LGATISVGFGGLFANGLLAARIQLTLGLQMPKTQKDCYDTVESNLLSEVAFIKESFHEKYHNFGFPFIVCPTSLCRKSETTLVS
jgi:hypothetical protein